MDFLPPLKANQALNALALGKVKQLRQQVESGALKNDEQLKAVARQFESIFVQQLLSSMRSTVPKEGLLDSFAKNSFDEMMDEELAKEVSRQKGIGLSDMIYRDLSRMDKIIKSAQEQLTNIKTGETPPVVDFSERKL